MHGTDVNTFSKCVYMSIAYSVLKKADFYYFSADTICSCIEGVDELFQHTFGHERMDPYVNNIDACEYMSIALSALKNERFSLL